MRFNRYLIYSGSFIFFSNDSLFSNASFFEKNLYLLLKSFFDFENLKASLNDFICLFEIFICFFQSSFSLLYLPTAGRQIPKITYIRVAYSFPHFCSPPWSKIDSITQKDSSPTFVLKFGQNLIL